MRSLRGWNVIVWMVTIALPAAVSADSASIVEAVEMAQQQSRLVEQAGLMTESARARFQLSEVDYRTRFGISGPRAYISVPELDWGSSIGASVWKQNRFGGSLGLGLADALSSQIGFGGLSQFPSLSVSWEQPFLVDGEFFNHDVFASNTRLLVNNIEERLLWKQDTENNVSLSAVRAYLDALDAMAQREHSSNTVRIVSSFADVDDAIVAILLNRQILEAEARLASSEIELSWALAELGLLIGRSNLEADALVDFDLEYVMANVQFGPTGAAEQSISVQLANLAVQDAEFWIVEDSPWRWPSFSLSASVDSSISDLEFSEVGVRASLDFRFPINRKDERTAVDVMDRSFVARAVLDYESEVDRVKTELSTLLSMSHLLNERLAVIESGLAAATEHLLERGEETGMDSALQLRLGDLALERRRVVTQIIYARLVSVGVSGGDVSREVSFLFER